MTELQVTVVAEPVLVVVEPVVHTIEVAGVGVPGPKGETGSAGDPLIFLQADPAAQWAIFHGRGYQPDVLLFVDPDQTERVWTDIVYVDDDNVLVEWPSPESGKAIIP
jgi:hypothetical protein